MIFNRQKAKGRTAKVLLAALLLATLLFGCGQSEDTLHEGYFTAEMAEFDAYGWKEYITIYVSNNEIVTVEYDAKNASGFIKSWDMEYMRQMKHTDKTYPNKYTREYAQALLKRQNPDEVNAVAGATNSHPVFQLLAKAALQQARTGDKSVAFVQLQATAPAE